MNLKLWLAKKLLKSMMPEATSDAASSSREPIAGTVKKIGIRYGDLQTNDFEEPEYDLSDIYNAWVTDSYIRQGVDKYVDQIFKEGFEFFGSDSNAVDYVKLRFAYIAEATGIPTELLLTNIAEDVVKYGNAFIAKARMSDANQVPPGVTVTGLNGAQPVVGYYCLNPSTMLVKRDKNGTVTSWQQKIDSNGSEETITIKPDDMVHIHYKRENGNAFGTSFLIPVLDDVRALRLAEENVLKMMYKNIYPFIHVKVGDKDAPGSPAEIEEVTEKIDNMDVDGGVVTSNRVEIKSIASDNVINAEPYIKHMEERVFTGLGVPAVMFGRGDTANRNTSDSMTSEMADRIQAIKAHIEYFFNHFILKELLMEGGYDPILNPEHNVRFKFIQSDMDRKIKQETHALYLYEHNGITEDEMRTLLGRDPITDRSKMFIELITIYTAKSTGANQGSGEAGNKETNNKEQPTNQHGKKKSPKKTTNSIDDPIELYFNSLKDDLLTGKSADEIFKHYSIEPLFNDLLDLVKDKEINEIYTLYKSSNEEDLEDNISTAIELAVERLQCFRKHINEGRKED